jgi:large subunit ribosomal protein L35
VSKMKTKRGAAKRFKVTGSGKVRFNKSKRRHILTKKSTAMKRAARKGGVISEQEVPQIRRMIPYKF